MNKTFALSVVLGAALCVAPLVSYARAEQAAERRLKMRVAVAPLEWGADTIDNWQIPVEFRNAINEKLSKKLLDTGRFVVLERDALNAILTEQGIKEENTGQSQRGKIVPAQALVRGKVTDFELNRRGAGGGVSLPGVGRVGASGADATMGINVRIFSIETSELLASENAKGTASRRSFNIGASLGSTFVDFGAFEQSPLGEATTKAIDKAVEAIVAKLGSQPWQARVADFDGPTKEATINAGSELGVRVGDMFEVHRISRVIKDPETGETLSVRTQKVGSIRVKEVERRIAIADLVDGTEFQPGDIVREIR